MSKLNPIVSGLLSSVEFYVVYAATFAYLLAVNDFPYTSLALFFSSLALIVYLKKATRTIFTHAILTLIIILSSFLILRANPFLAFLNTIAILMLGGVLIIIPENLSIIKIIIAPVIAFFRSLSTPPKLTVKYLRFNRDSSQPLLGDFQQKFHGQLIPILLSLALFVIVSAVLAAANPFFNQIFVNVGQSIADFLEQLFHFNWEILNLWIYRLILFIILLFIIPRFVATSTHHQKLPENLIPAFDYNLLIPKITVSALLIIFTITQIQLYTASPQVLQTLGYTNSQLTREVFAHMLIVGLIVFGLIYNDKTDKRANHILSYILAGQGIIMAGFGLKSVHDYVSAWGLTHKRLYGYAAVAWLTGAFSLFTYDYYRRTPNPRFLQQLIVWTGFILITINIANFDYLIFHHDPPRMSQTDIRYLTNNLSPDARHYQQLYLLTIEVVDFENPNNFLSNYVFHQRRQFQALTQKYAGHIDFRTFNYSEYRAFSETIFNQMNQRYTEHEQLLEQRRRDYYERQRREEAARKQEQGSTEATSSSSN